MSLYRDRRSPFWRFDPAPPSSVLRQGENTRIGARRRRQSAPSAGGSGISDPPHNALALCLIAGLCACGEQEHGDLGPAWAVLTQGFATLARLKTPTYLKGWTGVQATMTSQSMRSNAQSGSTFAYIACSLDEPDGDIDHKDHNGLNNHRKTHQCSPVAGAPASHIHTLGRSTQLTKPLAPTTLHLSSDTASPRRLISHRACDDR